MEGCSQDHGRLRGDAGRSGWRGRGSLLPGFNAVSRRFVAIRVDTYSEYNAISNAWAVMKFA